MGSREDVAARIEADTKIKIEEMNKAIALNKDAVSLIFQLSKLGIEMEFFRKAKKWVIELEC